MKKLRLQIETLVVESFRTADAEPRQGTVLGLSGLMCNTWDDQTCPYFVTCGGGESCDGQYTCNQNCWPQGTKDDRDPADPNASWPVVC
ncbi:MAG TPA: hypothetical protein VGC13_14780 [Longimicrobium sp.]|jgi:hypothetical protein|uniref:hypothetical protein n=1 Tax=Longimicrobium sp. TaxID=2029185 RepID=UPI002EDB63F4